MRILLVAALAAAVLAVTPALAQQRRQGQSPFPPGKGRDIVATACTQCHAPNVFTSLREGPEAWRGHVEDMIMAGAQIGPDDVDTVVDYLATSFGPGVNVPPATQPVTLPNGPGKELVENNCVVCHGLDKIAATKRTPEGWTHIVSYMKYLGAPLSDKDEATILSYLEAKFGEAAGR